MAELANRADIERAFANRLLALDLRHRRELLAIAGSPPDWSLVPEEKWQAIEEEQRRELAAILLLIGGSSARQHGLKFELAQPAAIAYADERAVLATSDLRQRLQDARPLDRLSRDASRFAVTETTAAQSFGGEAAAAVFGMTEADLWITEQDGRVCSICGPLHKAVRSVWMRQFPTGTPAHPNCRCYISYARERARGRGLVGVDQYAFN